MVLIGSVFIGFGSIFVIAGICLLVKAFTKS